MEEECLEKQHRSLDEKRQALGVSDELVELDCFTQQMLILLGEKGVKTLDDLADLASDELIEILGADAIDEETANAIIMQAREHWFEEEGSEESQDKE